MQVGVDRWVAFVGVYGWVGGCSGAKGNLRTAEIRHNMQVGGWAVGLHMWLTAAAAAAASGWYGVCQRMPTLDLQLLGLLLTPCCAVLLALRVVLCCAVSCVFLQRVMQNDAAVFRTGETLQEGCSKIDETVASFGDVKVGVGLGSMGWGVGFGVWVWGVWLVVARLSVCMCYTASRTSPVYHTPHCVASLEERDRQAGVTGRTPARAAILESLHVFVPPVAPHMCLKLLQAQRRRARHGEVTGCTAACA
jgi:hypothetical protein